MTREEFHAKWAARRAEWEKLGALVSGAKMCEEFIADFENVLTSHDEAVLNTNQAAAMTGYSRAQLLRQYKEGRLRGHKKGKHVFFRGSRTAEGPPWHAEQSRHQRLTMRPARVRGAWQRSSESPGSN